MTEAFLLQEYRLFCVSCPATCDVKATGQTDALREAAGKHGFTEYQVVGLLCKHCYWEAIKGAKNPTTSDPTAHDTQGDPHAVD